MKYIFDLIVIGGGHAGVEAALVAKRSGLDVALVTLDKTKTGRMSCNPAIGGIGKSHLTKEIDALGGYMAEATDLSGIQFRTLNKKKGPFGFVLGSLVAAWILGVKISKMGWTAPMKGRSRAVGSLQHKTGRQHSPSIQKQLKKAIEWIRRDGDAGV